MSIRRQATLYVPALPSNPIEILRSRFNPVQFDLIRAHVTLCREDEVSDWDQLALNVSKLVPLEVTLDFGIPVRENNWVYLPVIGSTHRFDELRRQILAPLMPRKSTPHITLIHPRNGICCDAVFEEITQYCKPCSITFRFVTLIQQISTGRWEDLQ